MAEINGIRRGNGFKDLTGARVGRLVVRGSAGKNRHGHSLWNCECDCGGECAVASAKLLSKTRPTKSCGCVQRENLADRNRNSRTHGMRHTLSYHSWKGLKQRCLNEKDRGYHKYGGRGITVCERWRDSFEAFLEDMGEAPPGHSIERVDVNGHYEPGNCVWATATVQNRNTRRTQRFCYRGKTMSLPDLCEMVGKARPTVLARLKRGWSIEDALEKPVRNNQKWRVQ